ncbi:hypothetical protein T12_6603 [Trichinella patagoniensis]|uniref:Uncharacterized protein n=1 Tax=Trichinella patagoniensis TaxID=990121 RepID=A0A0V0YW05_9BILA|nr:hypothetical protein T12_6603 [Trichinella patagoniensis]
MLVSITFALNENISTLSGFIIALPAINHVVPSSFEANTRCRLEFFHVYNG